jgi:hypothetical protein
MGIFLRYCLIQFSLRPNCQRSQADGNGATGVGLRTDLAAGRLLTATFTFCFFFPFRFMEPDCQIITDASKTSLLSNQ